MDRADDRFDPDEMPGGPDDEERFEVDMPEYGPPEIIPVESGDPGAFHFKAVSRPTGRMIRYYMSRSELARTKAFLEELKRTR